VTRSKQDTGTGGGLINPNLVFKSEILDLGGFYFRSNGIDLLINLEENLSTHKQA
jgi:hypothetical protein